MASRITFVVTKDDVAGLLCIVGANDPKIARRRQITKKQIMEEITELVREHGMENIGWSDEISEKEVTELWIWARRNVGRYTW